MTRTRAITALLPFVALLVLALPAPAYADHAFTLTDNGTLRWTVNASGITDTETGSFLVTRDAGVSWSGYNARYRCSDVTQEYSTTYSVAWDYHNGDNMTLTNPWSCPAGTVLSAVEIQQDGAVVKLYSHPFGETGPTEEPEPPPEDDDCSLLSCVGNFIAGIDDWIIGLFTPSQETLDAIGTTGDDLETRIPFSLIAGPIDWFRDAVGSDINCPEDPRPGGCRAAFSFNVPIEGAALNGDTDVIFGGVGGDAQEFARTLRPFVGALLWGSMFMGLALWAFKKYAPGGGGGE